MPPVVLALVVVLLLGARRHPPVPACEGPDDVPGREAGWLAGGGAEPAPGRCQHDADGERLDDTSRPREDELGEPRSHQMFADAARGLVARVGAREYVLVHSGRITLGPIGHQRSSMKAATLPARAHLSHRWQAVTETPRSGSSTPSRVRQAPGRGSAACGTEFSARCPVPVSRYVQRRAVTQPGPCHRRSA